MAAGNTYVPIATTSVSTSTATITLSSIPSTYTDLILIITSKISSGGADIWIRVNGDTASNYSYLELDANGTVAASSRANNQSNGLLTDWYGTPSNEHNSVTICQINNYSNSTTYKTMLSRANRANSGVDAVVSMWRSTSAINSLELRFSGAVTFDSGTIVSLYGIAAA